MLQHVSSLDRLVSELAKLPGVGPKTAQRLAYYILKSPKTYNDALRLTLEKVRDAVRECPRCFTFTENDSLCHYCIDSTRTDDVLCVVEDPADIIRIDSSGAFRGRYHVLHGAISPLEGVGPKDIRIQPLLDRLAEGAIREVILALDADLEGDTTVLYIAKQLHSENFLGNMGLLKKPADAAARSERGGVRTPYAAQATDEDNKVSGLFQQAHIKITRIAHGIPIGGDIDYIDHRTLGRALENRIEL